MIAILLYGYLFLSTNLLILGWKKAGKVHKISKHTLYIQTPDPYYPYGLSTYFTYRIVCISSEHEVVLVNSLRISSQQVNILYRLGPCIRVSQTNTHYCASPTYRWRCYQPTASNHSHIVIVSNIQPVTNLFRVVHTTNQQVLHTSQRVTQLCYELQHPTIW